MQDSVITTPREVNTLGWPTTQFMHTAGSPKLLSPLACGVDSQSHVPSRSSSGADGSDTIVVLPGMAAAAVMQAVVTEAKITPGL